MRVQRITRINEFTNGFAQLENGLTQKTAKVAQPENTVYSVNNMRVQRITRINEFTNGFAHST